MNFSYNFFLLLDDRLGLLLVEGSGESEPEGGVGVRVLACGRGDMEGAVDGVSMLGTEVISASPVASRSTTSTPCLPVRTPRNGPCLTCKVCLIYGVICTAGLLNMIV